MNKIIQAIATLMIILLLVVLIWVFLAYYGDNKILDTISYSSGNSNNFTPGIPNSNYVPNEKHTYDNLIESIKNNSGNQENTEYLDGKKEDETLSENIIFSGDINQQHNTENSGDKEEISNITNNLPGNKQESTNQIIISSETETSNEEKQEVLTEIDTALKGLLEAVGKIEIVDETRLDATLNSEVEIP